MRVSRWAFRLVGAVAVGAVGVGCGGMRKAGGKEEKGYVDDMREGRRPMGQVALVDAEKNFVLVRSPLAGGTAPERVLVVKSQGSGSTTGKLKVTPERSRNRLAADIIEGTPTVGDVVFFEAAEKALSMVPPPGESGSVTEGSAAPAGTNETEAGGFGHSIPAGGLPPSTGGVMEADLPPLGEPSGPRELVPDFPGLEPVPNPGVSEEPPPPAEPSS